MFVYVIYRYNSHNYLLEHTIKNQHLIDAGFSIVRTNYYFAVLSLLAAPEATASA